MAHREGSISIGAGLACSAVEAGLVTMITPPQPPILRSERDVGRKVWFRQATPGIVLYAR